MLVSFELFMFSLFIVIEAWRSTLMNEIELVNLSCYADCYHLLNAVQVTFQAIILLLVRLCVVCGRSFTLTEIRNVICTHEIRAPKR